MLLRLKEEDSKVQSKEYRLLRCEAVQSSRTRVLQVLVKLRLENLQTQCPLQWVMSRNKADHVSLCRAEFKT
jgi:hypothetical protein